MTGCKSWLMALFVAAFVTLPSGAAEPAAPTVVLRFKSIDGILKDARYLLGLVGQEELGKQLQGLLDSQVGPKGLVGTGIDTKKPFGVYVNVGAAGVDSTGAILIPISDQKMFTSFATDQLAANNFKMKQDSEGVYVISSETAPVSAFMGYADGYAYLTVMDKDPIGSGKRMAPGAIFPANDNALAAMTGRLDRVPDLIKQLGFGLLENRLADLKEPMAGEAEAVAKKRAAMIDQFADCLKGWIDGAGRIDLSATVDSQNEDVSILAAVAPMPGSKLATSVQGLSQPTVRFPLRDLAAQLGLNVALPGNLRDAAAAYVETAFKDAMSKERDALKKALLRKAFDSVLPTIRSGMLNVMAGVSGPRDDGKYSILMNMQLAEEKKVEGFVKEFHPSIPPSIREKILLDAENLAGTAIHVVNPGADLPPELQRLFGQQATVRLAFPKDQLTMAIGPDSGAVVKAALSDSATQPAPPMIFEGSIQKMVQMADPSGETAKKVARDVFGKAPSGSDRVQMSLQGGSQLQFKAVLKGPTIRFMSQLRDEMAGNR